MRSAHQSYQPKITDNHIYKFRSITAGFQDQVEEFIYITIYWTFRIKAINLFHDHGMPSMSPMAFITSLKYYEMEVPVYYESLIRSMIPSKFSTVEKFWRVIERLGSFFWFNDKLVEGGRDATCHCERGMLGPFLGALLAIQRAGFPWWYRLSEKAETIFRHYVC